MSADAGPARPCVAPWPEYCCAILREPGGAFWLEQRDSAAAHAPGLLTCFGGRREDGEHPDDCIARELQEELGWRPAGLTFTVRLFVAGRLVAWFYSAAAPPPHHQIRSEPGRRLVRLGEDAFAAAPLSPWHRAVLEAHLAGETDINASE